MKNVLFFAAVLLLSSCTTTYGPLKVDPNPALPEDVKLGNLVGVSLSEDPNQSSISRDLAESITSALAYRLKDRGIFDDVVYPYTEHAKVDPDYEIQLLVDSEFKTNMGGNMIKAVLIGASLFILSPVLPIKFDMNMDVEAHTKIDQQAAAVYEYGNEYQFKYTGLFPDEEKLEAYPDESVKHLVDHLIDEMLRNREDQ